MVSIGLERILKNPPKIIQGARLGLLCNQASTNRSLIHASELFLKNKKFKLTAFFGPQHGIRGEKQDNMQESEDFIDSRSNLPVFSLYSETRIPTKKMLQSFDVLLIDLQDIGTRIYTFMYTMENCLRACQKAGKKVVILDRPNPIGGKSFEGNILQMDYESFVGQLPLCTRHGMTMAELALYFNHHHQIGCDLEIISLSGWKRSQLAVDWDRDWIPPSPNIPSWTSALVFPGTVHFEGTNISEGRGTTRPFEFIGAPFVNPDKLAKEMNQKKLPGFYFRPIYFQPTFQKHQGKLCGGVQVHVLQPEKVNSFEMGVELLVSLWKLYPDDCHWSTRPYEYVTNHLPIDVISGTDQLRKSVEKGRVSSFLEKSRADAKKFKKTVQSYLLYK